MRDLTGRVPGLAERIRRIKADALPPGKYQRFIDDLHARYPWLLYGALTDVAAKHFGVSQRTVRRHAKDPR